MNNKNSEDYKEGFKAGIAFTCEHLLDTAHKFRKNMLELMEKEK